MVYADGSSPELVESPSSLTRFTAFATLPLCDPQASAAELVRAMDQLRLPGAMLFSTSRA